MSRQRVVQQHGNRVGGGLDLSRARDGLEGPKRRWVLTAIVDDDPDAVEVSADGAWLDCTIAETGEPLRVRWGLLVLPGGRGGVWMPPPGPGDEILVVCDGGDPSVALGVCVFATGDPQEDGSTGFALPAGIVSEPSAVHVVGASARVVISSDAAGGIVAKAPLVELGDEGLPPQTGVVQGEGIDPATGLTYFALGNASAIVRAKK